MIRPILACQDPYETGRTFRSAGWTLDFTQPPESGDPLVGVSLYGNALLLGVTEGYVAKEELPFLGCGVELYLTVPEDALEAVHASHRALCPTEIEAQPWGDRAFEVTVAGWRLMIAGSSPEDLRIRGRGAAGDRGAAGGQRYAPGGRRDA